jgi:hypothetical protein
MQAMRQMRPQAGGAVASTSVSVHDISCIAFGAHGAAFNGEAGVVRLQGFPILVS